MLLHQPRIGRDGRLFTIVKFRTMLPDRRVADPSCRSWATTGDPDTRRTTIPATRASEPMLRRWSLDELPQLVNVVRGDMSLVGPASRHGEPAGRYEPWQHERHTVKPGLTGVWQVESATSAGRAPRVRGRRHRLTRGRCSCATDLRVLLRTPFALIRRPAPAPGTADARQLRDQGLRARK